MRIRQSDTLARLGGDEFTVILSRLRTSQDAELVAHSLLDVLAAPYLIGDQEIVISASIGISVFPDSATEAVDLLQQADSAMSSAKRDGKNHFRMFTAELGTQVRERLNLESLLRTAVARGEIEVHYQPEFDAVSHRLIRFEALARWVHPTLGTVPPLKFIPIAEGIPVGAAHGEPSSATRIRDWRGRERCCERQNELTARLARRGSFFSSLKKCGSK